MRNGIVELDELYSPGTPLAQVRPEFRGMPYPCWRYDKLTEQIRAFEKTLSSDPSAAPLSSKRIWTPRDSYGIKSV